MRAVSAPRAHTATTAHLQAAYPFMAEGALGGEGCLIGQQAFSGAAFCFDPWVLYAKGLLRGPSMVIAGQVGHGKSALVKTYAYRQAIFGRRIVVVDPKGEYAPLCEAYDTHPVRLEPGATQRLNPLEVGTTPAGRVSLLAALLGTALGRDLGPEERAAVAAALQAAARNADPPTLPLVGEALLAPTPAAATELGTTTEQLAAEGRACALALRDLNAGALAGMFDGPTSIDVDLTAPVVAFDISRVPVAARPIVMACVAAWLEPRLQTEDRRTIFVLDEAWALVANPSVAEFLQRLWKLARSLGVQNILVVHRLTDLVAAGDEGSRVSQIARGLLSESETVVILRQDPADLATTRTLLGLTDSEVERVTDLPAHAALWRVGRRSLLIEHRITTTEAPLVDTDQRMHT